MFTFLVNIISYKKYVDKIHIIRNKQKDYGIACVPWEILNNQ